MRRLLFSLALLLGVSLVIHSSVTAQTMPVVSKINVPQALENQPLSVSVELVAAEGVKRVLLRYRRFGEGEFQEIEMLLAGRSATITISPSFVSPPYLEYYVVVESTSDRVETYPLENPEASPLKISVKPVNPKDLEVRILSPEPGETVAMEELVITVSLFYASDNVDVNATKLYLDGTDITPQSIFSDDLIMYSPANFPRPLGVGAHSLRVELRDKSGNPYHTLESSFSISTAVAIAEERAQLQAAVNGSAEYRNEKVGTRNITYTRGDLRLNGSYGAIRFGSSLFITKEEKSDRQPQNRYLGNFTTDFLRIDLGDAYPKFPSLIVSGKRVRGISSSLMFGFFNLDVAYGQVSRAVDGSVDSIVALNSRRVDERPPTTRLVRDTTYEFFQAGMYSRDFLAVRPSFGSGEHFQLGFTYLKSKDNVSSILRGVQPKENLVVGTDLLLLLDDDRIRLETQGSLSVANRNIKGGSFTKANYDSIKARAKTDKEKKDAEDLEQLGKLAEKFITVNEYLTPFNPVAQGLPGVALEGTLTLNYLNNFIRGSYFRRGASYLSFGNEFLQTDIQGFNISDRIRMIQNKVLLGISYEQKKDNTANTRVATTTFGNVNASATVFPGAQWPSFTLGYGIYTRKNDADISDPRERNVVADEDVKRIVGQLSYDFSLGARNNLVLSVTLSDKKDKTFFQRDQTNNNYSATLNSVFRFPLEVTLGALVSENKSQQRLETAPGIFGNPIVTEFTYTSATANFRYRLFDDLLRLALGTNSIFGDINRTVGQFGVDLSISATHSIVFQVDYIQNPREKDDTITSLMYRFNL